MLQYVVREEGGAMRWPVGPAGSLYAYATMGSVFAVGLPSACKWAGMARVLGYCLRLCLDLRQVLMSAFKLCQ